MRGAPGTLAVSIGFMAISFEGETIAIGAVTVKNKTGTVRAWRHSCMGLLMLARCFRHDQTQGETVACRLDADERTGTFNRAGGGVTVD